MKDLTLSGLSGLAGLSGLSVYWFAVLMQGQALFFEYRSLEACMIVQKAYARVLSANKITSCQRYHEEESLKNKGSVLINKGIENAT